MLIIISFISCFLSLVIIFDYFERNFEVIDNRKKYFVGAEVLLSIIIGLINLLNIPLLNFISWIVLLTFLINFFFYDKKNDIKKYIHLYILLFILAIFETVGILFFRFILYILNFVIESQYMTEIFEFSISKLFVILFYPLIRNKLLNITNTYKMPKKQLCFYMCLTVYSIISICILSYISNSVVSRLEKFSILFTILGIVMINFYVIKLLTYISENTELKYKIKLSELNIQRQFDYYKKVELNYNNSLKLLHDIDKHITIIENLYKDEHSDLADEYINKLDRLTASIVIKQYSTHPVVNALLNDTYMTAKQNSIHFSCDIASIRFDSIDALDLTIIIGNLLENAIHECQKTPSSRLSIKGDMYNNFIILKIENTCITATENTHFDELIKYGTGLNNVVNTLKKYDGDLKFNSLEHMVNCTVILPSPSF